MAYPIFIQTDTADFDGPLDLRRAATPSFWSGTDIEFRIACFEFGVLKSVDGFKSLTVEIKAMRSDGSRPLPGASALMSKTVTGFNDDLTAANWALFADSHVTVSFSAEESAVPAGAHWLVISAVVLKSGVEQQMTLAAGQIIVAEDGHGTVGEVVLSDGVGYTKEASDARYARIVAGAFLHVSATGGSDVTALRGRADLPFATLGAAFDAASDGDTVFVAPGTYAAATISKPLSIVFFPGSVLSAPLAVEADGVKLSGVVRAGTDAAYSFYATSSRSVRIDGVLSITKPFGPGITVVGGLLLEAETGTFSAPGMIVSGVSASSAWDAITGLPESFTPASHAATHSATGSDPITPADIGALTAADLASETQARDAAISTLATDITTNANAIASEASARTTADTTLANNLSSEATTRANAVTSLTTSIANETTRATAAEALKLARASNLSDLADVAAARSSLELNYNPLVNIMTDSGRFGTPASVRSVALPTTSYSASTLSMTAATATITDSAGKISTTTFAAGTLVTMTGWTNSANNLVQLRVASVSATTLVLEGDGASTLVDESAGASVALTAHQLTNTSGLFAASSSSMWWAGKFIFNNTTNGGSSGALSPVTQSLLTALQRSGTEARYGVEFGLAGFTANGTDASTYYQMTINDGSAWFGGVGNYLTKGFWAVCVSGSAKIGGYYASFDGGNYAMSGQVEITTNVWRHYKAYNQARLGYKNSFFEFVGTPGTKVIIALPAAFPGLIPAAYTWNAPLINYYRS